MARTVPTARSLPGTVGGRGPMSQHKRIRLLLPAGVALALGLATPAKAAPQQYYELVDDCDI